MITRRQHASRSFTTGSSGGVPLDQAPLAGSTILLFLTQAEGPGNVAAAPPSQANVSYTFGGVWGAVSTTARTELWIGYASSSAGTSIGVNFLNPAFIYPLVITAVEYTGLAVNPLDVSTSNSDYSNTLFSGVTGATDPDARLLVGAFASRDVVHEQTDPSDGFGEVRQDTVAAGPREIRLGLWDKVQPNGGDPVTVSVHSDFAVDYVGVIVSFIEDTSVINDVDTETEVLVADNLTIDSFLNISVVSTSTVTTGLNITIESRQTTEMSLFVKDDSFNLASQLNVLVSPYVVADLEILVQKEEVKSASTNMYVTDFTNLRANCSLLVLTQPRFELDLSIGVLALDPLANSVATPESSIYRECRPLWCGVPQTKRFDSALSVWISDERVVSAALLDMMVVANRVQQGFCDVSIA